MHIALILDGNGRFATAQNQPRLFGHEAGIKTLKLIAEACPALGIKTLTVYAFAIANWNRDKEEVDGLWFLFRQMFQNELQELAQAGIRIRVIGKRDNLEADVQQLCAEIEEQTKDNKTSLLQIALNYDGVDEVARFVQKVIKEGVKAEAITADYIKNHLDTEASDEPDIIVRTGMPAPQGELGLWRSSSFLLLQSAQSVCVSTTTLWPDFSIDHLKEIIQYADPDSRLFGGQRK